MRLWALIPTSVKWLSDRDHHLTLEVESGPVRISCHPSPLETDHNTKLFGWTHDIALRASTLTKCRVFFVAPSTNFAQTQRSFRRWRRGPPALATLAELWLGTRTLPIRR
jgi:hypothetical protein